MEKIKEASFLRVIENFIKENGIILEEGFKCIPVSKNLFPEYFNNAIIEELKSCNRPTDKCLDYYFLKMDVNRNLYLEINGINGAKVIVIKSDTKYEDIEAKKTFDMDLIKLAEDMEYLRNYEFFQNPSVRYLEAIKNMADIQTIVNEWAEEFCKYISYLYSEYLKSKDTKRTVFYNEPEQVETGTHTRNINSGYPHERQNEIISLEERKKILIMNNPYLNSEAKRNVDNKTTHIVYAYKMPDNTSRLVMEPISGCNTTKIAYIGHILDDKEFGVKTSYYLSLNFLDSLNCDSLTRHFHTTSRAFENLICYVTGNGGKVMTITKRRVTKAVKNLTLNINN